MHAGHSCRNHNAYFVVILCTMHEFTDGCRCSTAMHCLVLFLACVDEIATS